MDGRRVRPPRIFNTPLESGLRSVIILSSCFPVALSLRRLVVLDHLIVHTEDVDGPESLHPKEGARGAEILVRRKLVASGLMLMSLKNMIVRNITADGFRYLAGPEAGTFIDYLRSGYSIDLKCRAEWLKENVVNLDDAAFDMMVKSRIDAWATEFEYDY